MKATVGVFEATEQAAAAVRLVREAGLADRLSLLTPDSSSPGPLGTGASGTGSNVGAVVGGATGGVIGLGLGAAASAVVPGVGPVLFVGVLAALLAGGGAIGGASVGEALETALEDPSMQDELHAYREALRDGRTLVIAITSDAREAGRVREAFEQAGAERVAPSRTAWWRGLRGARDEAHEAP